MERHNGAVFDRSRSRLSIRRDDASGMCWAEKSKVERHLQAIFLYSDFSNCYNSLFCPLRTITTTDRHYSIARILIRPVCTVVPVAGLRPSYSIDNSIPLLTRLSHDRFQRKLAPGSR